MFKYKYYWIIYIFKNKEKKNELILPKNFFLNIYFFFEYIPFFTGIINKMIPVMIYVTKKMLDKGGSFSNDVFFFIDLSVWTQDLYLITIYYFTKQRQTLHSNNNSLYLYLSRGIILLGYTINVILMHL